MQPQSHLNPCHSPESADPCLQSAAAQTSPDNLEEEELPRPHAVRTGPIFQDDSYGMDTPRSDAPSFVSTMDSQVSNFC